MAAKKLQTAQAAVVLGSTIHLYGVSAGAFLANTRWLRHELKHIEQYGRLGRFRFVITYLWQTLTKGYYNAPLEIEARVAEDDENIIARFELKNSHRFHRPA